MSIENRPIFDKILTSSCSNILLYYSSLYRKCVEISRTKRASRLLLLCVRLDESGEVVQIHYSTRYRDTFCRQSLDNVEPLYRALRTFSGLIYDPQNLVEMKLKAGMNALTAVVCGR